MPVTPHLQCFRVFWEGQKICWPPFRLWSAWPDWALDPPMLTLQMRKGSQGGCLGQSQLRLRLVKWWNRNVRKESTNTTIISMAIHKSPATLVSVKLGKRRALVKRCLLWSRSWSWRHFDFPPSISSLHARGCRYLVETHSGDAGPSQNASSSKHNALSPIITELNVKNYEIWFCKRPWWHFTKSSMRKPVLKQRMSGLWLRLKRECRLAPLEPWKLGIYNSQVA